MMLYAAVRKAIYIRVPFALMGAICVFFFSFSACCSARSDAYAKSQAINVPVAGEYDNPARPIRVGIGDRFIIVLDSNATTGYSWQAPERTIHVSLNSHKYEAPLTSFSGAGGKEYFEFTAQSLGKESLIFQYERPWEKSVPPVKTLTFTVDVIKMPKTNKK